MERVESEYPKISAGVEETPVAAEELRRWPALGYVLPFAVFVSFLLIHQVLPVPQPVRFLVILALLPIVSRGILPSRPTRLLGSVLLGIAVFFLWIGPDVLIHGYRDSILFSNAIVGKAEGSTAPHEKVNFIFLLFRVLGSVVTIPIIEELFWRGWMMRWLVDHHFYRIPIGVYTFQSFWLVALLFASEHGSFWDVGLLTGAVYNWWAMRTRNLTDCVIAHAVTNACLAVYVIGWAQWQYWL
jgi:CAAX prenyl protease-like protein